MTKSLRLSLCVFCFDSVHFDARSAAAARRRSVGNDAKMTATLMLDISSAGSQTAPTVKPSLPPLAMSHQPTGPRCFLRTSSRQTSPAMVVGQAVRRATAIRILPLYFPGPVLLFAAFQSFTSASSSIHPAASSGDEAASITAVKVKRLPT
ncbi:unnamed protein product [Pleuronectes platessa]|uniref:Uncharacterized protein n=1 Tax=Pleuronectes platessa TaxID=8262 RepID=A0A9N7TQI5_PLEPL|nr:unnamed protein product [Pleuronectes platessa]